jgi:hypothetical protein
MSAPVVRFRIDFAENSCVGPSQICLLEAVRDSRSLAQGARNIGMSCRGGSTPPHGPGPVQARYRWLLSAGRTQDLPRSWRIHPIPLPRCRIPAGSSGLTLLVACGMIERSLTGGPVRLSRLRDAATLADLSFAVAPCSEDRPRGFSPAAR